MVVASTTPRNDGYRRGRDFIVALDPTQWLLTPTPAGDGKPWGTGTKMAERAMASSTPWDVGCKVTTIIGGFAAMSTMCDALETVISNAQTSTRAPGDRGHVYLAGWRFNCQRDLSSGNPWKTGAWSAGQTATTDQTALGLILRLMQAGVGVRVLVWYPTFIEDFAAHLTSHVLDHTYLWRVVKAENERLVALDNLSSPIGIVGLDKRVASGAISGAHHQKMLVIRSPWLDVAFCGGVDFAFSRRDSPANPGSFTPEMMFDGDWQSGNTIPAPPGAVSGLWWPKDATTNYASVASVPAWAASDQQGSDLPTNTSDADVCTAIGGAIAGGNCVMPDRSTIPLQSIYGTAAQYWHDQHLKLEGPIVSTLEWQFAERWIDAPKFDLPGVRALETLFNAEPFKLTGNAGMGSVAFSAEDAYNVPGNGTLLDLLTTPTSTIKTLDDPVAITSSPGASIVQMWRTIPMRDRPTDPFLDGEFTIMEGISKAIGRAKELIWMFDQYFWSEPLTHLLNARLQASSTVCVLIILPPHADAAYDVEHRARHFALEALYDGLSSTQRARVAVYDMWRSSAHDRTKGRGIYVHAKSHTYDGSLLVCGSANLNRRSLTCDSELSCAVLDAAVVAAHQQKLWNMLFAEVSGPSGVCPTLDLNQLGSGSQFLASFVAAAASNDAFVVPDPWDDDNPLKTTPVTVTLPNGVPRPALIAGPLYEIKGRIAIDAGSLQPTVEDDVMQANSVPRPARLDDIVGRIERHSGSPPQYPRRKAAGLLTGQVFHMPAIVFAEGGFHFTDQLQWWKEVCIGFPCFVELGWPGYESGVIDHIETGGQSQPLQIDGHDIVIQIWRGWCERGGTIPGIDGPGMPGGVGVEIGIYRKIPNQLDKFLKQIGDIGKLRDSISRLLGNNLPTKYKYFFDNFASVAAQYGNQFDQHIFWPFPELDASVEFTFSNPANNKVLLQAKPSNTYWRIKWMDVKEYVALAVNSGDHPIDPRKTWNYDVDFTVTGKTNSHHIVWTTNDPSIGAFFPPRALQP